MDNTWQAAFADEVRAELGRQNRSARSAYTALGLSSSTWQGYFKRLDRAIPSSVMIGVANYLGLPLSELVRRAEDRERQLLAGPRVDVDKILRDAPHLAKVREEGQRLAGRKANNGTN